MLSIHYIDPAIRLNEQRTMLKADDYIQLAILGFKAFLAASNSLGASAEHKRFVRHDELPQLNDPMTTTGPEEGYPFVKAVMENTGWVDRLPELLAQLRGLERLSG